MLVKIFTKEDGPETRKAFDLGKSLEVDYRVEYYDADDSATTPVVELYDVYSYPTFMVTGEDGVLIEIWRGMVPLESDVKMFLIS